MFGTVHFVQILIDGIVWNTGGTQLRRGEPRSWIDVVLVERLGKIKARVQGGQHRKRPGGSVLDIKEVVDLRILECQRLAEACHRRFDRRCREPMGAMGSNRFSEPIQEAVKP